jgi:adenylate cyclase
MKLIFSSLTLDLERLCLLGPAGQIRLRPKSFEVLRYLVERAGQTVTKDELIAAIWPDVTVSEESLTRCISDVRLAIGDHAQRIIKTLPKRGTGVARRQANWSIA